MRITVVTAQAPSEGAEVLRDLGCALRVCSPLDAPESIVERADVVFVEAGDDAEVGRFVIGRVRASPKRAPVLLSVRPTQLTRVDPAWSWDDLVLQPYVPQELYVRLRALEWRTSEFSQPERVKLGELVLDPAAHEARVAGRPVELAPQEFALLLHLSRHRGRVLTRPALLRDVWGLRGVATRTVDVHVRRLRVKLSDAVAIETVRGVGYRLRVHGSSL